ncbi:MAG: trypsin-like peptidase domain-containing protein, partial [bacterium]
MKGLSVVILLSICVFVSFGQTTTKTRKSIINQAKAATVWVITDKALGSGFVVSSDGYIVTNKHVVDDAAEINVFINNRDRYSAKIIEKAKDADVAILKIETTKPLATLELADSSEVETGEEVFAVGYPLPTEQMSNGIAPDYTLTFGHISGLRQPLAGSMLGARELLQHDTAITWGNSGGPLVLISTGKAVGVNTWGVIYKRQAINGLKYSVPSNTVLALLTNLNIPLHLNEQIEDKANAGSSRLSDLLLISESHDISSAWLQDIYCDVVVNQNMANSYFVFKAATGRVPTLLSSPVDFANEIWLTSIDGSLLQIKQLIDYEPSEVVLTDASRPFFYPPVSKDETLYAWSGSLGFWGGIVPRTDFFGWGESRLKATISGTSTFYAYDIRSKAVKWSKESIFISSALPHGKGIIFGGLSGYGALSSDNGEVLWSQGSVGKGEEHPRWYTVGGVSQSNLIILEIPLRVSNKMEDIEEGDPVAVFGNGIAKVLLADVSSGKVESSIDLGSIKDFRRALNSGVAIDYAAGQAVCVVGAYLYGVDLNTRKVLWTNTAARAKQLEDNRGRGAPVYSSELIIHKGVCYVGNSDNNLYAIDMKTGKQAWQYTTRNSVNAPTISEDKILMTSEDGTLYALDIA